MFGGSKAAAPKMEVVRSLDLQRYMGRWYEMAKLPTHFQPRDSENTRATYTLDPDGKTMHVLNETWSNGKRDCIKGVAYWADPSSDEAKFKLKFYVPPFLPIYPVVGDYWVIYVNDDYQYAVVGEPARKNLWILSRAPHIDDATFDMLVQKAQEQGYDVSKLRRTPQSDHPPEAEQTKSDRGFWWIKSRLFGK